MLIISILFGALLAGVASASDLTVSPTNRLSNINSNSNNGSQQQQQHDQESISITMPDIRPDHAEQYLCMAHRLPINDPAGQYIVGFNPKSDASRVHHMLIYGCQMPGIYQRGSPNFVWDCGEMHATSKRQQDSFRGTGVSSDVSSFEKGPVCQMYGKQQILYGWALDAPSLKLPEGVGFEIGGQDTGINFIVLQVHYGHYHAFQKLPDLTDNSGFVLDLRPNNPTSGITKQAGVLLLISLGYVIPGESKHEIWCDIDEDIEIHPFRFRVHTHKFGTKVLGAKLTNNIYHNINNNYNDYMGNFVVHIDHHQNYQFMFGRTSTNVKDESVIIGSGDPQQPQMFYPIKEKNLIIRKGDTVYGRCEFNNNGTNVVKIGSTGNDEMCNFYLMYWTDSPKLLTKSKCFGRNPPRSFSRQQLQFAPFW